LLVQISGKDPQILFAPIAVLCVLRVPYFQNSSEADFLVTQRRKDFRKGRKGEKARRKLYVERKENNNHD
jgi:hypothetical protein